MLATHEMKRGLSTIPFHLLEIPVASLMPRCPILRPPTPDSVLTLRCWCMQYRHTLCFISWVTSFEKGINPHFGCKIREETFSRNHILHSTHTLTRSQRRTRTRSGRNVPRNCCQLSLQSTPLCSRGRKGSSLTGRTDRSIAQSSSVLSLAGWKSGDGPRVLSSEAELLFPLSLLCRACKTPS